MSSLNCRNGINVSYREKSLKVLSSIWFWMGVLGVGVVSYGLFDAIHKQQQVSVTPLAIESDQEDTPIEIKENNEVEDTTRVLRKQSLEENTEQAEAASEEEPKVVQVEVSLDMARVGADGLVTLAGRAAKGATIEVLVGENLIGTIAVGQDGNFASIFELNSSEEIRVLVLRIKIGEEFSYADQSVVILPSQIKGNTADDNLQVSKGDASIENSVEAPSVETSNVDGPTISQELVEDQKDLEKAEPSVEIDESADLNVKDNDEDITDETVNVALDENGEITPFQPKVVVADSDGVKVLQDDQGINDQLALDSIAYDPFGNVTLGGRSNPSGLVRFYVNDEAISAAKTNEEGYWETDLSDIIPGIYTLRIDQLSLKGDVISRLESPFKREDREKLAKLVAPSTSPARINIVTVQPGNTLWAISRKRYGDGLLYVRVYEANRDKIKDPDLIYPGQLFDLPDLN